MVKSTKKRSWRKANIQDVEDSLEDDRLIKKLKTKSEASGAKQTGLFSIDTSGNSEGISGRSRREIARARLFPPKPANIGLSSSEQAKIERAEQNLAAKSAGSTKAKRRNDEEVLDLWGQPLPDKKAAKEVAATSRVRRQPKPLPLGPPKTLQHRVGAAPAVLPAHEGQSMNPATEAYEDLVSLAAAKQLEVEREAEEIERKMKPLTAELRDSVGEEEWSSMDAEAKARLMGERAGSAAAAAAEEEAGEQGGDDGAGSLAGPFKRKSQAAKNREKRRKNIDAKKLQRQAQRKLEKSVGEVGAILKEMKRDEEWRKQRKEYRAQLRATGRQLEASTGAVPRSRRLGRTKFSEEAMGVPDEEGVAKGSMRGMPLRQSAIKERMSSILRRGLLAPPPEVSSIECVRIKNKLKRLKKGQRFYSPLLRDNNLLR